MSPKRCKAHSSRTGEPCRKWAMAGQEVCDTHGGMANKDLGLERNEKARHKLAVERVNRRAGRFLATYGGVEVPDQNFNATAELLRLYREAVVLERAYRLMAEDLDDDVVVWSKVRGGALHPVIEAWHAQQDRVVSFGVSIGKLGIEQRQVVLAEEQTHALVDAILGSLADPRVGLTVDQQQAARRVVAERLRALDSEPVAVGGPPRPALSA